MKQKRVNNFIDLCYIIDRNPGKMVPGKNGPRRKGSSEKWSPRKMVPGKLVPGKMVSGKLVPGNSETKNRGLDVEHRRVCMECWDVINLWKPKTRKRTQNTETKNRGVSVEHHGVFVECSDVINLWKPKTRQKIFLDSFSVLQFGVYVGSWRKRQTFFCMCSGINS